MHVDDQTDYWDSVATIKTFTHPLDIGLLTSYVNTTGKIIDYGCGYGRLVEQLLDAGFVNVTGYDTSKELIKRGVEKRILPLFQIHDLNGIAVNDNTVDAVLLFAVLTCMPSNSAQQSLIDFLYSKLKPGGIIYISDYYLQDDRTEVGSYQYLDGDKNNFGVFSLPEGAVFRHHREDWIAALTKHFRLREHNMIDVKTMNGSSAKAFQMIVQKNAT